MKPRTKENWDDNAFYAALCTSVSARGTTWKAVGEATGVSPTTLCRMAAGRHPDAASLAALSAWAGLNPVKFFKAHAC